jgi:hypothetical protein
MHGESLILKNPDLIEQIIAKLRRLLRKGARFCRYHRRFFDHPHRVTASDCADCF